MLGIFRTSSDAGVGVVGLSSNDDLGEALPRVAAEIVRRWPCDYFSKLQANVNP